MKSSFTRTLVKLGSNTSWLFLEQVISIGVAVAVGLYFVRYLGPDNYGLYGYALGLYGIFAAISKLGINSLVVNETVQSGSKQGVILASAFTLRMAASLACIVLLNGTAYYLIDEDIARRITFIFSAALLFGPFETITHWFEANVRMKPMAVTRSLVTVLMALGRLALILMGFSLFWFAWLVPLEGVLTSVLFLYAYHNSGLRISDWKADVVVMKRFIQQGAPLFFSALAAVTYLKIDQVMLGKMSSPREVGIYAAAVKISEMFYFVPMILSGLLFPYLIKFDKRGEQLFQNAFQLMCDGFAWIALILATLITLFSTQIITLAYGEEYLLSARILVVHVWAGMFIFIETLRSKWFVIRKITRFQLITMSYGAAINVLLNLFLIPRYQGYGAAVATMVSYGIAIVFSCFFSRKTWVLGTVLFKSLVAPIRIFETTRAFNVVRIAVDGERP